MNALLRRRAMMAAQKKPLLPPEYQQVEYIGNTSFSYIRLPNMNFTQNSVVKCVFRKRSAASNEEALFLAQPNAGTVVEVGFLSGNTLFAYSKGGTSSKITNSLIYGNWVDYTAVYQSAAPTKKATAIINGTTINGTDGTGENSTGLSPCALFTNPNGIGALACRAELASFALVLEETLSLNCIPCYRKSDGEIGMYDTVSQTFFTNAGPGTFTKGADVN